MVVRYDRNRRRGIVDRAVKTPVPARENDRLAKAAEVLFAVTYGLPIPSDARPVDSEFTLGKATIDVKWTPRLDGSLIHFMGSRTRSTFYVLIVGMDPMTIVGWAWGKDLHASVRDLGHGPTYVLRQDELRAASVDLLMASLYRTRP